MNNNNSNKDVRMQDDLTGSGQLCDGPSLNKNEKNPEATTSLSSDSSAQPPTDEEEIIMTKSVECKDHNDKTAIVATTSSSSINLHGAPPTIPFTTTCDIKTKNVTVPSSQKNTNYISLTEKAQEIRHRQKQQQTNTASSIGASLFNHYNNNKNNNVDWTTIQALQELNRKYSSTFLPSPTTTTTTSDDPQSHDDTTTTTTTNNNGNAYEAATTIINTPKMMMNQSKFSQEQPSLSDDDDNDYHSAMEDHDIISTCSATTPMTIVLTTTRYYEDTSSCMTSSSSSFCLYNSFSSNVKNNNNNNNNKISNSNGVSSSHWCWKVYHITVIFIFFVYSYIATIYGIIPILLSSSNYPTTTITIHNNIIPSSLLSWYNNDRSVVISSFSIRYLTNKLRNSYSNHNTNDTVVHVPSFFHTQTRTSTIASPFLFVKKKGDEKEEEETITFRIPSSPLLLFVNHPSKEVIIQEGNHTKHIHHHYPTLSLSHKSNPYFYYDDYYTSSSLKTIAWKLSDSTQNKNNNGSFHNNIRIHHNTTIVTPTNNNKNGQRHQHGKNEDCDKDCCCCRRQLPWNNYPNMTPRRKNNNNNSISSFDNWSCPTDQKLIVLFNPQQQPSQEQQHHHQHFCQISKERLFVFSPSSSGKEPKRILSSISDTNATMYEMSNTSNSSSISSDMCYKNKYDDEDTTTEYNFLQIISNNYCSNSNSQNQRHRGSNDDNHHLLFCDTTINHKKKDRYSYSEALQTSMLEKLPSPSRQEDFETPSITDTNKRLSSGREYTSSYFSSSFITTLFHSQIRNVTTTSTSSNPNYYYLNHLTKTRHQAIYHHDNNIEKVEAEEMMKRKEKFMMTSHTTSTALTTFTASWHKNRNSHIKNNNISEVISPVKENNNTIKVVTTTNHHHSVVNSFASHWDWTKYFCNTVVTMNNSQTIWNEKTVSAHTPRLHDLPKNNVNNNSTTTSISTRSRFSKDSIYLKSKNYDNSNVIVSSPSSSKLKGVSTLNHDNGYNNKVVVHKGMDNINDVKSNITSPDDANQANEMFWKASISKSMTLFSGRPSFVKLQDKRNNDHKKMKINWKQILSDFTHHIRHDDEEIMEDEQQQRATDISSSLMDDTDSKIRFFQIIDSILVKRKHLQIQSQLPEWMKEASNLYDFLDIPIKD